MLNKLKKISLRDIFGIIKFLLVLIPSIVYKVFSKLTKKELWLICENENIARDNGYVFYKYIKEKHPEIRSFYAIDYKSPDYNKVKDLGSIIKWSSLKHYFLYMSATKNISSHKQGNPNHTLFTFLHLYLHLYNNRIFLQHGVLYQNFEMFHKKNCYFKKFICGAKPEYDFVNEKYGYDKNEVKYTGLARFDNLHNSDISRKKIVLYMPTWRRYLSEKEELYNSDYYKKIESFINSKKLDSILEKNGYIMFFCPHDGLRKGMCLFKTKNKNVKVIDVASADIQKMLIESSIMITDFSSIHTDFAYMKKPLIYYQFDKDDYLKKHIGNGYNDTYYDFEKDGFGKVVHDEESLLYEIQQLFEKKDLNLDDVYLSRIDKFFVLNDSNNCKRIYDAIVGN